LVFDDPFNCMGSVFKSQFMNIKADVVPGANFISVVTVDDHTIPNRQRLTATICRDIVFQLLVFIRGKRRDQRFEFRINSQIHQPPLELISPITAAGEPPTPSPLCHPLIGNPSPAVETTIPDSLISSCPHADTFRGVRVATEMANPSDPGQVIGHILGTG
jgi:hypothetical protein